ncbi:hypothetical protein PT974_09409 [Cladobotryum mycophilum]|uniref:Nucleoside phosphorylase domain-containing protein n=1 Tax=Cladobotryum mycophilum TaxID=491253 RepID=A0ABR0SHH1_9HYPO
MATAIRPNDRSEFEVAIICALPREYNAFARLFDQVWDEDDDSLGRADSDPNYYTIGSVGRHAVVLFVLPGMGTNNAAAAVASLRSSFGGIKLALLVGICGGIPKINGVETMLGDVVISKNIVQYDYGRLYPGHFEVRNTVVDSLSKGTTGIRSLIATLETELAREKLQDKAVVHLRRLQQPKKARRQQGANYKYPGIDKDKLFPPEYLHIHRSKCQLCGTTPPGHCHSAAKASCADLECNDSHLVQREGLLGDEEFTPAIFVGGIGSGNAVMRSGEDRDRFAAQHELIAFEMEGAGAWEQLPCLVIKGVCDYADSHKNKEWQDFAAATAASVARAVLERYAGNDKPKGREGGNNENDGSNGGPSSPSSNGGGGGNANVGNNSRNVSHNTFGNNGRIVQGDITYGR